MIMKRIVDSSLVAVKGAAVGRFARFYHDDERRILISTCLEKKISRLGIRAAPEQYIGPSRRLFARGKFLVPRSFCR
jgi:hypothetical protein